MSSGSIKDLNEVLARQPYVSGYVPSIDDEKQFRAIFGDNINVIQWAARMASYYPTERAQMQSRKPTSGYDYTDDTSGSSGE